MTTLTSSTVFAAHLDLYVWNDEWLYNVFLSWQSTLWICCTRLQTVRGWIWSLVWTLFSGHLAMPGTAAMPGPCCSTVNPNNTGWPGNWAMVHLRIKTKRTNILTVKLMGQLNCSSCFSYRKIPRIAVSFDCDVQITWLLCHQEDISFTSWLSCGFSHSMRQYVVYWGSHYIFWVILMCSQQCVHCMGNGS